MRAHDRLALLAFAGHAPGLWLVARHRLDRDTAKLNGLAVALTVAAVVVAGAARGGRAAFVTWLAGHLVWGAVLALRVRRLAR